MRIVIALPIFNEEHVIESSLRALHGFLASHFSGADWKIVVADNGSTDRSRDVALALSRELSCVEYQYISLPGKGGAIRAVWESRSGDVFAFMASGLATDLAAFPSN